MYIPSFYFLIQTSRALFDSCIFYTGSGEFSFLYFLFQVKFHNISSYPTYHSIHDTFAYVKKFVDPQFTTHLAIAQVWASAAFLLAHTPILPINCSDYATALRRGALDIKKTYEDDLTQKGISLGEFDKFLFMCMFHFRLILIQLRFGQVPVLRQKKILL